MYAYEPDAEYISTEHNIQFTFNKSLTGRAGIVWCL